jgi:protein-tyrosine-phosphatase
MRAARPRSLEDVLADGDYIITVCDNANEEIRKHDGLHWSVPDPVRIGTDEAFEVTFAELTRRVTGLVPRVAAS